MRILDPGSRQLTNGQVLNHIYNLEAKYEREKRQNAIPDNLKKMMRDVKSHLTLSPTHPSTNLPTHTHATLSTDTVIALSKKLRAPPYRLLPSEVMQILNHVPTTRTELCMIVEEGEERFGEEVLDRMLEDILGVMAEEEEGSGDVEMDGAAEGDGR